VYVRLEVQDQGTGMSPQIRDRVFEPFFTTREPGKGTGLGLSTAYGIAQQHGGWIDCESELGVGTTFRLFLPTGPTPDENTAATSPAPDRRDTAETIVGGSETILVIDDEERIRRTVSKMLTRCGYTVLLSVDGQDGVDTFRRQREDVDLVILDLSMPNMPGEEALHQLRVLDADVRVIIFTGRSTEAEGLPVDGLIQKPVTMDELTQAVRRILDN
jgi:two-component system cell cycle sensor histidine kinase/response regulator CckA